MSLTQLHELLKALGIPDVRQYFEKYGPTICPDSKYQSRDLDFRVTQISDCVVVFSEISPAGVINLIDHCWVSVFKPLRKGVMCRGYITKGPVFHTESQIIGSAYQKAYENELNVKAFKQTADKRGTPFVEIDPIKEKQETNTCEKLFCH